MTLPSSLTKPSPLRDAVLFVVLTLVLTWLFWIPGAYLQSGDTPVIGDFLLGLGSFAPLAVAFYLNIWSHQPAFEVTRWVRTLTARGLLVSITVPFILLVPVILLRLYWGTLDFEKIFADAQTFTLPLLWALLLSFGEEAGWRGFLVIRLESLSLVVVNLIVGVLWFIWQLPLWLTRPIDGVLDDTTLRLTTFFVFSILITPFLNRLSMHYGGNVLLPTIFRAMTNIVLALYALQAPLDSLTHPYGLLVLAWLGALNVLLFAQLWQGKRAGWDESELERVLPLEAASK
jgi:hypothetical protein